MLTLFKYEALALPRYYIIVAAVTVLYCVTLHGIIICSWRNQIGRHYGKPQLMHQPNYHYKGAESIAGIRTEGKQDMS